LSIFKFIFYVFILVVLGFEFRDLCLQSSPFCSGYFEDGGESTQTVCPGWFQTMILPISAS
jgi:hypothetical protein